MLANKTKEISTNLKKKFLYDNDINSLNLLINIYDSDEDIGNIFPKYMSMSSLRKEIKKHLRGRKGNDLTALNIAELIHNDINRFELLLYLETYKLGYKSSKHVNYLEKLVLKYCAVKTLYTKNIVRHKINTTKELNDLRKSIEANMTREILNSRSYRAFVEGYARKIIKPKIFVINRYLDKQVKMHEDRYIGPVLKYETKPFMRLEIISLYKKIVKILIDDGIRILTDAYWTGLIEKVLRRYK